MKCVKNVTTGNVTRVSDTEAERRVATGKWTFITRDEWRKAGRPRG